MSDYETPTFEEEDIPTDYPQDRPEKHKTKKKAWAVIPPPKVVKEESLPVKREVKQTSHNNDHLREEHHIPLENKPKLNSDQGSTQDYRSPHDNNINHSVKERHIPIEPLTPPPESRYSRAPIQPVTLAISTPISVAPSSAFSPFQNRLFERKANLVRRPTNDLLKMIAEAEIGDVIELTPASHDLLPVKMGLTYCGLGEVNVMQVNFEGLSDRLTQIIGINFIISGPLVLDRPFQFERCQFRFSSVKTAKDVLIDSVADTSFHNCSFRAGYHLGQKNLVGMRIQKGRLVCVNSEFKFETITKSHNYFFQLITDQAQLILQTNRFFVTDAGESSHFLVHRLTSASLVVTVANVGFWINAFNKENSSFIPGLKENELNQFILSPENLWNIKTD